GRVVQQFLYWAWQFAGHWGREALHNFYWFVPFYSLVILFTILLPDLRQEMWDDILERNLLHLVILAGMPFIVIVPGALWITLWRYYRWLFKYLGAGFAVAFLLMLLCAALSLKVMGGLLYLLCMGLVAILTFSLQAYLGMEFFKWALQCMLQFLR
ncbi:MAG: hypothetical protein AAF959_10930, partial [Cyanobacteria bacterium P01_D01_bin.56]